MKEKELIDLDVRENIIIAVTYNGKIRSLAKDDLLRLIKIDEDLGRGLNISLRPHKIDSEGRNLNSLGKRVSRFYESHRGLQTIPGDKCQLLAEFINQFDGKVEGKRSTQIYHHLDEIEKWDISHELKTKIRVFLDKYNVLRNVPKR